MNILIELKGIAAETVLGLFEYEHTRKTSVLIDLALMVDCDINKTAVGDIDGTVDYDRIKEQVIKAVTDKNFSLIEEMAVVVLNYLKTVDRVLGCVVKVTKKYALLGVKDVSVTVVHNIEKYEQLSMTFTK